MRNLPRAIIQVLRQFELLFSERVWEWAKILLIGAILAPGKRTVTAALRVMGLSEDAQFQNYHRVLNRAKWSPRAVSRVLLGLLLDAFVPPDAPVVVGLDDHIERRRGKKIAAKGIYRDPVRSSRSFFVKTSGLRWLSMMLLVPVPWAKRIWALPFLTVLAPSERYAQEREQRHKSLTDWARQMIMAGAVLAAQALAGGRRRQHLCRYRTAGCLPELGRASHAHYSLADGCGALRPGSAAPARNERCAAQEGDATADTDRPPDRPGHRLAREDSALVWWADTMCASGE
jgi:hypothetical protein